MALGREDRPWIWYRCLDWNFLIQIIGTYISLWNRFRLFFSLVVYVFFACYYAHLQRFSISSCPLNTAIHPFSKGFSSGFFYLFSVWQGSLLFFKRFYYTIWLIARERTRCKEDCRCFSRFFMLSRHSSQKNWDWMRQEGGNFSLWLPSWTHGDLSPLCSTVCE